jgi:hypothetical protein
LRIRVTDNVQAEMNLVDAGIVLIVVLGLYIGWSRGLIGPLAAQGAFVLGAWAIWAHPSLLGSLLPTGTARPLAVLGLPAVIGVVSGFAATILFGAMRIPLVRWIDKPLGAVVNGGVAFVVTYVLLLGLVGTDKVLSPLNGVASIQSAQVAAIRSLLSQYPQAAGVVGPSELSRLADAASVQAVPLAQLGQYAEVISVYEKDLRPQLATSLLAPLVLKLGERLPVIGRRVTIPKA